MASVCVQYGRYARVYIEVAHHLPKAKLEVKACNILIVNNLGFKSPLYKNNRMRLRYTLMYTIIYIHKNISI